MKKTQRIRMMLCLLAALLALTACTRNDKNVMPTNTPGTGMMNDGTMTSPGAVTTAPGNLPMTTGMMPDMALPGTSANPVMPDAAGVTSVSDARKAVEQIEDELERLSEVDDAQVMIAGNSAAVALEFEKEYQGGIDTRMRDIVKERINNVINGITRIAITEDRAVMYQLERMGEQLDIAVDMTKLQNELNAVINKIQSGVA